MAKIGLSVISPVANINTTGIPFEYSTPHEVDTLGTEIIVSADSITDTCSGNIWHSSPKSR